MPDALDPGRRFTDREVALVLRTAAEMQPAPEGGGSHGLSLRELEQIAREAGIDPALVRRAVAQLDTRADAASRRTFVGAPVELTLERTVEGEITEGAFEELVATIRRMAGDVGDVSTIGRSLAWKGRAGGPKAGVTVTPLGGRTTVRVHADLDEMAVGVFMMRFGLGGWGGGLVALGITSTTLGLGTAVGVGSMVLVAGMSYLASRRRYRRAVEEQRRSLSELLDAVASVVERHTMQQGSGTLVPDP